jgi:hypothetical protein
MRGTIEDCEYLSRTFVARLGLRLPVLAVDNHGPELVHAGAAVTQLN